MGADRSAAPVSMSIGGPACLRTMNGYPDAPPDRRRSVGGTGPASETAPPGQEGSRTQEVGAPQSTSIKRGHEPLSSDSHRTSELVGLQGKPGRCHGLEAGIQSP